MKTALRRQDWPHKRGNWECNSSYPAPFAPPLREVWRKPIKGDLFIDGPIVGDGKVFVVGDAMGRKTKGNVYCFDLQTGHEEWTRSFKKPGQISWPCFSDGSLFGYSSSKPVGFMRISASGELVWHAPLESGLIGGGGGYVQHEFVLCGFDNGYAAILRADTGEQVWREKLTSPRTWSDYIPMPTGERSRTTKGGVYNDFIPWNGKVIFPLDGERLVGLDLEKRKIVWQHPLPEDRHVRLFCLSGDILIYTEYSDIYNPYMTPPMGRPQELVALDLAGDRELWRLQSAANMLAYACLRGALYQSLSLKAEERCSDWLAAIELLTGREIWRTGTSRTVDGTVATPDAIYSVESLHNSSPAFLAAYHPDHGKPLWKLEIDPTTRSPALAGGKLVTVTWDGLLTCYEPEGSP